MNKFQEASQNQPTKNEDFVSLEAAVRKLVIMKITLELERIQIFVESAAVGSILEDQKLELIELCRKCRQSIQQLIDQQSSMTSPQAQAAAMGLWREVCAIKEKWGSYERSRRREELDEAISRLDVKLI